MTEDEERIGSLVEHWAAAVHRGDMDAVLEDHAEDIVMFDGLRREQGRWAVAHEHHSLADTRQ